MGDQSWHRAAVGDRLCGSVLPERGLSRRGDRSALPGTNSSTDYSFPASVDYFISVKFGGSLCAIRPIRLDRCAFLGRFYLGFFNNFFGQLYLADLEVALALDRWLSHLQHQDRCFNAGWTLADQFTLVGLSQVIPGQSDGSFRTG